MTGKLKVGLFFGGRSGEHEVSLMSARSVLNELDQEKYQVTQIGITKEGRWLSGPDALKAFEGGDLSNLTEVTLLPDPGRTGLYSWSAENEFSLLAGLDVAFPVLHGTFGEDGTLQGYFELAEMPYVGAGVLASSVAMDKAVFKNVMRATGIPVIDWVVLTSVELKNDMSVALERAEQVGPYPLFTKPANMGSSVGIMRCDSRSDLVEGLQEAARFDRRVIVERGINAREIEVSVLGNEDAQASVPGEIVPGDQFYSYKAKYFDETSELIIPAKLDVALTERTRAMALAAYQAIDGAGMARVDFLLDRESGELFMNEINTIPGFTKISMYPKLWEASGLTYSNLLDSLIKLAFERAAQKSRLVRSYGGAQ
ncbi:MAG: D-alanine--D-alanine ligase [Anaerolineales bacterium]|nr:D-alanine--D-alanine ligase [Anaerolineales bacterium]